MKQLMSNNTVARNLPCNAYRCEELAYLQYTVDPFLPYPEMNNNATFISSHVLLYKCKFAHAIILCKKCAKPTYSTMEHLMKCKLTGCNSGVPPVGDHRDVVFGMVSIGILLHRRIYGNDMQALIQYDDIFNVIPQLTMLSINYVEMIKSAIYLIETAGLFISPNGTALSSDTIDNCITEAIREEILKLIPNCVFCGMCYDVFPTAELVRMHLATGCRRQPFAASAGGALLLNAGLT